LVEVLRIVFLDAKKNEFTTKSRSHGEKQDIRAVIRAVILSALLLRTQDLWVCFPERDPRDPEIRQQQANLRMTFVELERSFGIACSRCYLFLLFHLRSSAQSTTLATAKANRRGHREEIWTDRRKLVRFALDEDLLDELDSSNALSTIRRFVGKQLPCDRKRSCSAVRRCPRTATVSAYWTGREGTDHPSD